MVAVGSECARSIAALAVVVVVGCRDPAGSAAGDTHGPSSTGSATSGSSSGSGSGTTAAEPLQPLQLRFDAIEADDAITMATELRFLPGSDELLIASKDGRVAHYRLDGDRLERLGGFTVPGVHSDLDCGLVSLTLSPTFADDRLVYVGMCTSQTDSGVFRLRFRAGDDDDDVAPTVRRVITAGDPSSTKPWHNVGSIGFDATGALWALFGDKRVADHGQAVSDDLAALVRVIPLADPDADGSSPAPDNPFVADPAASPNVYAYGLRSPWRGTLDDRGRWWIGDVGANGVEEIDLVRAPGDNFGWPRAEGPCATDCAGLVDPVTSWPHDVVTDYMAEDEDVRATVARVAWVGLQYAPGDGPDPYDGRLTGAVLFGDYCLGFVRAIEVDDRGVVVRDDHLGHLAVPSSWDRGPDGFVYATTFGRCETAGLDETDPPPSLVVRAVPAE